MLDKRSNRQHLKTTSWKEQSVPPDLSKTPRSFQLILHHVYHSAGRKTGSTHLEARLAITTQRARKARRSSPTTAAAGWRASRPACGWAGRRPAAAGSGAESPAAAWARCTWPPPSSGAPRQPRCRLKVHTCKTATDVWTLAFGEQLLPKLHLLQEERLCLLRVHEHRHLKSPTQWKQYPTQYALQLLDQAAAPVSAFRCFFGVLRHFSCLWKLQILLRKV